MAFIPQIGFQASTVEYARHERAAGSSHYPLKKMLKLAFDGITSLSVAPIRAISIFGFALSVLGLVGIVWAIVTSATGSTVDGWASIVCIVALFGGIQLLCLGVIGEYIGRIYLETKRRPRYIIQDRVGASNE